ncbi:hypothetical protein ACHAC9_23915 [Massilia sp. CMS3.1]|uniref:hypothetical protein n=1 Tax=Massilia sp. CMS3.1 TaxID=3373083 RepID=UPI003EE6961C
MFSEEFKREAVKLVGQLGATGGYCGDLGISAKLLGRWHLRLTMRGARPYR